MQILFITPYPFDEAPSQRFRFEQYLPLLQEKGIRYKMASFLTPTGWRILYCPGHPFLKGVSVFWGFVRRLANLFLAIPADFVFIHREASPVGPPIFEWIIRFVLRKKIIYDFDDAIWLEDPEEKGSFLAKLKWKRKVKSICRWSYKISAGNDYLAHFARQYNQRTVLNPTTLDTAHHHNPDLFVAQTPATPILGWTGTHSTLPYLRKIIPVLEQLYQQKPFTLRIISNRPPDFSFPDLDFILWSKENEAEALADISIGLMPLTPDPWSEGKCGFKALQYMAMAKPCVASPVGVNQQIIAHGENGFLAETPEEWLHYLTQLLTDESLRIEMGRKAQKKVVNNFSIEANIKNFLSLFDPMS